MAHVYNLKNRIALLVLSTLCLAALKSHALVLNNPYPARDALQAIYYTSFSEQPKTLDPARSYSSNEYQFLGQIYEPLLQYDYFLRPATLTPLLAVDMPQVNYYDAHHRKLTNPSAGQIAQTVYTIRIRQGVFYQPHPALAKDERGQYRYHHLSEGYLNGEGIAQLSDFKYTGTRELIVDDFIYEIKRLATPFINSPIYSLMSEHILGFHEFARQLPGSLILSDLRSYPLAGVRKLDDYTFEIIIKGHYPQFIFWLAMPFFAPMPWEAEAFYAQPGMSAINLSLDWYPIGTGPFLLGENNPNSKMVLEKNPNYHPVYFPGNGTKEDIKKGYMRHAGERLPLLDKAVFILEKETIPRWNKFLQGYYDLSGISTDSFDQAVQVTKRGTVVLSKEMQAKGMQLDRVDDPTIYYLGFNMLDPVVGGKSERARKLRQAISIAVNYDEYIAIFYNGRGKSAQGPIPQGIFGYEEGRKGMNPYLYTWRGNQVIRRPVVDARQLMTEAGYPNGIDPSTGEPLILHYDATTSGGPDEREQLNWMRKQFSRIGIALDIRGTQYNQFQEKMRNGNAQMFTWGWNADYPDPENFLFLLYGENGKVKYGGENAANYENVEYDQLYQQMKSRDNDEERLQLIRRMNEILRKDAPWVWGINTQSFILSQRWVSPIKNNTVSYNTLKYMGIDVAKRNELRIAWNKPILWPVIGWMVLALFFLIPFLIAYFKRQQTKALRVQL